MSNPQDPGQQGWNQNPQPWNQGGAAPQPPAGGAPQQPQQWGPQGQPHPQGQQNPQSQPGQQPQGQQYAQQGQPGAYQQQYGQQQYAQQGQPGAYQQQYGQQQYGQQPYAQQPDASGTTKKKSKTPAIIAAVVALALVVGGGIFALNFFRTTANPADALPGNAGFIVKVDLNPSDSKKLDAYRFLTKFPAVKKELESEDAFKKDPGKAIWEAFNLSKDTGWDYDADVAPWIGDSVALAGIFDGSDEPVPVISAHMKDKAKAKATFDAKGVQWAEHGDFALILPDRGDIAAVTKQVSENPLSKSDTYATDMGQVGTDGIMTFWVNGAQVADALKANSEQEKTVADALKKSRVSGALHISPDNAEVRTYVHSEQKIAATGENVAELVGNLPSNSSVVLAGSVDENTVNEAWNQAKGQMSDKELSDLEQGLGQLGLSMPDDLNTLLGKRFALVADVESIINGISDPSAIRAALVSDPRDAAKQASVWQNLTNLLASQGLDMTYVNKGLSAASPNAAYADEVLAGQQKLSGLDAYTKSVDVGSKTQFILFLNAESIKGALNQAGMPPEVAENVEPLLGIGMTSEIVDDHGTKSVLRIAVK